MSEREDKGRVERPPDGHFSSHNSCRSALRGRGLLLYVVPPTRRKIKRTGSGAHHDGMATHAYTAAQEGL